MQQVIAFFNFDCSISTLRKYIVKENIFESRYPKFTLDLSPLNKMKRLYYACYMILQNYGPIFWKHIIFMDEKTFKFGNYFKLKVWVDPNLQDYHYTIPLNSKRNEKVNVRYAICYHGPLAIMFYDRNLDAEFYWNQIFVNIILCFFSESFLENYKIYCKNNPNVLPYEINFDILKKLKDDLQIFDTYYNHLNINKNFYIPMENSPKKFNIFYDTNYENHPTTSITRSNRLLSSRTSNQTQPQYQIQPINDQVRTCIGVKINNTVVESDYLAEFNYTLKTRTHHILTQFEVISQIPVINNN